ncbi:MAG: class I SAM-dependent methyltransferase [Nitrospiraceae bacterium]|nr:class I SAM-dependent methyltransferase [Nitrospiraceae bacterium]
MTSQESTQQFLDHVQQHVTSAQKAFVLERHYDTVRREMVRAGNWKPGVRLLDVGCGIGVYAEFWRSRGFRVTALDVDARQVALASRRSKEQGLGIRYEVASGDRLPFEAGSFDVVYANSLLEHVEDWERCLHEWIRVLAPGGLLWVETTNALCPRQGEFRWLPLYSWWPGCMKRIAVRLAKGPLPVLANYTPCPALHWFSFFQLERFFHMQGLAVRDRFDCLDSSRVGWIKRTIRRTALASRLGRRCAYLVISPLVVIASRPV